VAIGKDRTFGRQLRTLIHLGSISELSDGQLLERFATTSGEAAELAFSAIVERHGPMVLRVCRSVLDDPHASEDAFQATFLVLVARGRTLWVRDSLGPWLHQVAHRTARCARSNAARRNRLERQAHAIRGESSSQSTPETSDEVERILLEEIDRLPERFKSAVVLCDLEGQTHEAAARALGWPIGTVKSRQARARERLRAQLTRRGFGPTSSLALLALPRIGPTISAVLIHQTTTNAIRFLTTRAIARGSAAYLAQEVLRSMMILRSLKFATLLIGLGATGSGAVILAHGAGEAPKKPDQKASAEAKPKAEEKPQPPEPPKDKTVFTVKPGKLELTLSEAGTLEPSKAQDLLSEVEGTTTIISIRPEGTMVKKGEVVCELDSAFVRDTLVNQRIATQQAETSYRQAKLVREVAEFAVREYREGTLPTDRSRFKGKIADAMRSKADSETRLGRTKMARKKLDEMFAATKGPTTPADVVADLSVNDLLEAATRNLAEQAGALELAKSELETLEKFTVEQRTRRLTVDVESARAEELSRQSMFALNQTRDKKLERQIEKCSLRAIGDGMVVYANDPSRTPNGRIMIEEGATVRERQRICRVIDLKDPMLVVVKVPERIIDLIEPGQKVRVRVGGLKSEALLGSIVNVAPMPDNQPAVIVAQGPAGVGGGMGGRNSELTYTTWIKLDQGSPKLRPYMSARTEIIYKEIDNVLVVPRRCLISTGMNTYPGQPKNEVDVKTPDGTIERREVILGESNNLKVVIKEGLKAGDQVVRIPNGNAGFQ
jgi:HlyD family secretion protein